MRWPRQSSVDQTREIVFLVARPRLSPDAKGCYRRTWKFKLAYCSRLCRRGQSSPLALTLSPSPSLRLLRTALPPAWDPSFLVMSENPSLRCIVFTKPRFDVGANNRRYREGRGRACSNFGRTEGSSPMARGGAEAPPIDGTYCRDVRVRFPGKCVASP